MLQPGHAISDSMCDLLVCDLREISLLPFEPIRIIINSYAKT
jgi:hypothetical protein